MNTKMSKVIAVVLLVLMVALVGCSNNNDEWRVKVLNDKTAETGVIRAATCLFTISNYWVYGTFEPRDRCELPGKLFVAKAAGEEGARHAYYAPAFWGETIKYTMGKTTLYAACKVKAPKQRVAGGQFSLLAPKPGPWEVWCNYDENGALLWYIKTLTNGKWVENKFSAKPSEDGWFEIQITMKASQIQLQVGDEKSQWFTHDAYEQDFMMTFGSAQSIEGGEEVVSNFRSTTFSSVPYPHEGVPIPDGPEDIRPGDNALCYMVNEATPQDPRHTEGDLIQLKDGSLLLVWSYYYAGTGHDGSPARLEGKISKDGGKTWLKPWTVAEAGEGSAGNVMSVSLIYANNGDLLMAYLDKTPEMKSKSMVLVRSKDEGKTWGPRLPITPNNGNRHYANNACFQKLSTGRLVLACREYIGGIRWPYAVYSDDDGKTWKAGKHVPDPELTDFEKRTQNLNEPMIAELADGRLLMTMRSIAGGQFFSYSSDGGETWTKPYLSPLRGTCSPAAIERIPGTDDILAIWTYGFSSRTPLVSAISSDNGKSWKHLKLVEQSQYHSYCYTSITIVDDKVYLTYMHMPHFDSLMRFEVQPGYIDTRLTVLPIKWFYRDI